MGERLEFCCNCDNPTGRAGAADGSLYCDGDGCGVGPLCETCFDAHCVVCLGYPTTRVRELEAERNDARSDRRDLTIETTQQHAKIERLEAEVERLEGEIKHYRLAQDAMSAQADAGRGLLEAAQDSRDASKAFERKTCQWVETLPKGGPGEGWYDRQLDAEGYGYELDKALATARAAGLGAGAEPDPARAGREMYERAKGEGC